MSEWNNELRYSCTRCIQKTRGLQTLYKNKGITQKHFITHTCITGSRHHARNNYILAKVSTDCLHYPSSFGGVYQPNKYTTLILGRDSSRLNNLNMFVFANICDFGKLFKLNTKTVHACGWRTTQPALVAVYAVHEQKPGGNQTSSRVRLSEITPLIAHTDMVCVMFKFFMNVQL